MHNVNLARFECAELTKICSQLVSCTHQLKITAADYRSCEHAQDHKNNYEQDLEFTTQTPASKNNE